MSNGASSQNDLGFSSHDSTAGGSSPSPASTPAPTQEVVDVEAGNKGVPVILREPACLSTTPARGTCTSCWPTRSKPSIIIVCFSQCPS